MSTDHNKDESDESDESDECEISPILPDERYLSQDKSPEHERQAVCRYVELEADDETVTHLEKVTSSVVSGRRYDVWDVHTDINRWWVITNPTNLYAQSMFPSMDMCLTFHVGLVDRVLSRDSQPDELGESLIKTFRRMDAASDALDDAREAEDFQAIGMRLRETLLYFIREVADSAMVAPGTEEPKLGDFIHWSELIADYVTPNGNLARIRSLLKAIARETWQTVNWLTHTTSADRHHAEFCADAVRHLLSQFSAALRQLEDEPKERCPRCDSYRLATVYRPEFDKMNPYWTLCEVCGWEREPRQTSTIEER